MVVIRTVIRSARQLIPASRSLPPQICRRCAPARAIRLCPPTYGRRFTSPVRCSSFHTTALRQAQSPTADELMESLEELYATAKDEFEIAAEETEKKTVYAQDDREAAREALTALKDAFDKAVKESDPEVAKEISRRAAQRVRELEHAVIAMEESALED